MRNFSLGIITFLTLSLLTVVNTQASSSIDPNIDYKKANELYAETKYSEAIEIYEDLIRNEFLSTDIFFNLGNAYYKKGQIPLAILNYEKALKLQPDHEDAIFNLKIANTKTIDKIEAAPDLFITNTWNRLVTSKTTDSWAYYTVILILIASLLLISYLIAHQVLIKKSGFYGGLFFLFLGLFCWLMAIQNNAYHQHSSQAIIMSEAVTIKSEPNNTSEKLFTLHEGTKVYVLENTNEWSKIKLPNGNEGWIKVSDIVDI